MKPVSDQNYYELLEVPYHATWGDIQKAYQLAKKTYTGNTLAADPLFSPEDRAAIFKKMEEAYQTLSQADKRKAYDDKLAQTGTLDIPTRQEGSPAPPTEAIPQIENVTGHVLKGLREARGLSLQEIAYKTRINPTYLSSIEEDQMQSLPPEVYLRGYLTQYAQILRLDAGRVTGSYLQHYHRWKDQNP